MFCTKCGVQNEDGLNFCANCGAPLNAPQQPQQPQYQQPQQPQYQQPQYQQAPVQPQYQQPYAAAPAPKKPANGMAVASLVLGILSLLLFPAILGSIAIILAVTARQKGNKGGVSMGGLVCGIIGVASWLIMLVACGNFMLVPF